MTLGRICGIITYNALIAQLFYEFCGPFLAAVGRQPKRWPIYHSAPPCGRITAEQLFCEFGGPFLAAMGGNRKDGQSTTVRRPVVE